MSKWIWFYDLVERKLGDLLEQHRFKKLTGKGYEEDENKEHHGGVFYGSDTDVMIDVNILIRHKIEGNEPFYLIRLHIGKHQLKEWLYPNIRSETEDVNLWRGWPCSTQDDVEQAFDEIAVGLKQYLNQPQE